MNRLPFDPDRAEGGLPADAEARQAEDADALTVSELSGLIRRTLEQRIAAPLRVVGEVSNLSRRAHLFFSLKDDESVVRCVAWATTARRLRTMPEDGDQVIVTGHVSHYGPQGRTQLYVSDVTPVGAGELERRFRQMCDELRRLGYFDEARKRPLPLLARRVAVITSAESAALADVVSTSAHRCPCVGLVVCDVRVQGEGAAPRIAAAIRWVDANRDRLGVDAILVTRGGGSIEDLWAFNERVVADAVLACGLPIVAAIGHESDTTVIELVADLRAATPTQAVMRLVPEATQLVRQIDHHGGRLDLLIRRVIETLAQRLQAVRRHEAFRDPTRLLIQARTTLGHHERHLRGAVTGRVASQRVRLEQLASRLGSLGPAGLVDEHRRVAVLEDRLHRAVEARTRQRPRLDGLERRLAHAARATLGRHRRQLDQTEARLRAVDPRHVLRRGFSYTTLERGGLVRSTRDTRRGDALVTHLADGTVRSIVEPPRRRDAGGTPTRRTAGPGLFDDAPSSESL